jgi:hypothetical protein
MSDFVWLQKPGNKHPDAINLDMVYEVDFSGEGDSLEANLHFSRRHTEERPVNIKGNAAKLLLEAISARASSR